MVVLKLLDNNRLKKDNSAIMPHYLDPKSDLVFKKIFGHHPELLKSFLNSLLPLPHDCVIESLTYLPTESVPELAILKHSIVDVLCLDNYGRHFIVEMQLQWTNDFIKRILFNTAATYVRQLEAGEMYKQLSPVYGLALIDATFTEEQEWFHHYRMTSAHDKNKSLEDIQLVFIELPKLKPTSTTEKRLALLWLRFLKEINERTETVDSSLLAVEPIREALTLLETSSYTKAELRAYYKSWDAVSTEKTLLTGKYDEGLAKGLADGKAEGLAEGKAEGKAEIILKMHRSGLPLEQIARIAQLPEKAVREILDDL